MIQGHKWTTADTITSIRIAASLLLLFLPLHTGWYLAVYTFTGLTDALDGWLARKTGTASEFGARLDSIADLLFYAVLLVRLFPVLWQLLPMAVWYTVTAIVLIRLLSYATAAVKYHRFAALHTWLNKVTGFGVFLMPYVLAFFAGTIYCWTVCIVAFAASVEELLIHLCRGAYYPDRKSIFQMR